MYNKKLCFRFDIDTHKCIRDGVPKLLDLAEKEKVPFSFYLNAGKSVSFVESLKSLLGFSDKNKEYKENIQMMSALKKLGIVDYVWAAFINPNLFTYREEIKRLLESQCEVGLHGGKNHALWLKYAKEWNEEKVASEIEWALEQIRKTYPDFQPKGFASPGWNTPFNVEKILLSHGFSYLADYNNYGGDCISRGTNLTQIGVNLIGEPGGVAFFENCRVKGMTDDDILEIIKKNVEKNEVTILYDHPYYAGIKEIGLISKIIRWCQINNVEIGRIRDLI